MTSIRLIFLTIKKLKSTIMYVIIISRDSKIKYKRILKAKKAGSLKNEQLKQKWENV